MDSAATESVQRDDVPVVVQQDLVNQATELVRVKTLLTAPKWSLHKYVQQPGAPASVNVADLTTILSRDGTYRAQAVYTIKNRSRQFLALQMPEGTELLSVFVAGQPSRAVAAALPSLKGATAQLIALPKSSAASLAFEVHIVWRGPAQSGSQRIAQIVRQLVREEVSVPAPQILSQQDDADYGIPVGRTRWTVYLPQDLDAQAVNSATKHNLTLSNDTSAFYGNAALQEVSEIAGFLEQTIADNRRTQSVNNVKQLGLGLDSVHVLSGALDQYDGTNDGEFAGGIKAESKKRLAEIQKKAADETTRTEQLFAKSRIQSSQMGTNFSSFQAEGLSEGEIVAQGQQRTLIESNGGNGILINPESERRRL